MASRRELLDSLKPGMHLNKNFFLKVYGYEITRPGFAEDVIKRLEILGCSKDVYKRQGFDSVQVKPSLFWNCLFSSSYILQVIYLCSF